MHHTADPEKKDQAEATRLPKKAKGHKAVYAENGRQYTGQA